MRGRRLVLAAALALLGAVPSAHAAVGDLIVADPGSFFGVSGRLLRVAPSGGVPVAIAVGRPFRDPMAVAIGGDGDMLVADAGADALFRVAAADGAVTAVATGRPLDDPVGVAIAGNVAYVTDRGADGVLRVDLATGGVVTTASGAPFEEPSGIAVEPSGALLVADRRAGSGGAILRVDPGTGAVTTLASGHPLTGPRDVAVAGDGGVLVADDTLGSGRVIRVDPGSGAMRVVASGEPFVSPRGIDVEQSGDILVVDRNSFGGHGGVIRVDPDTGDRSRVASGHAFVNPSGLAVVRPAGSAGGGGPGDDGTGVGGGVGTGAAGQGGTAGPGTPGGSALADAIAPVLSVPRLAPETFRAARRGPSIAVRTGTTISYSLSEPARVRFTVQQRRHLSRACKRRVAKRSRHRTGTRCRTWISLRGSFAKASAAGRTSLRFSGRLRGRRLRAGAYRLVVRATDAAGNVTRPIRPGFHIVA